MYHTKSFLARHALAASLAALSLPLWSACGGDGGAQKGEDGRTCTCEGASCGLDNCGKSCGECGDSDYCALGECATAEGCDLVGFEPTSEAGFARYAGGQTRMRYVASQLQQDDQAVDDLIYDKLIIEINQDTFWAGGAPAAGTFDLGDTKEQTSPLFVRGYTFCNELDCAFPYVVERGTLELAEPGAPGAKFTGKITDLRLKQVRIDANTGEIKTFTNANTWCVGDYRFEVDVPALPTAQGTCLADGSGTNIGDNIRNFSLTNCLGEVVDLHERCGKSEALWIIASAGWCGACETFVPQAAERANQLADQGLDLIVVVGENNGGAQPSLEYCKDYAGSHGLDPRQTYVDHDGTHSWPVLFGAINTYSNGSIGLPYNIVLDGRSMEYKWNSATGSGDLYQVQEELMSRAE
ncbi:MAG: redoxin domain-containing protein [Deltaproteobacteria bacterium]|nr:redoxin domain-containing protein [Deltaproteobacteria bacterium]